MLLPPEETALLELDDQLRRSACDRCRCQKLRCERPGTDSGPGSSKSTANNNNDSGRSSTGGPLAPCRRCQRVGAVCNTSFQQRPGRPRLSNDSSSRGLRRARARRVVAHASADICHHSQQQLQQQSSAAAAASPHRPETLCAEQEKPFKATQGRHIESSPPVGEEQNHVSSGPGGSSSSSPFSSCLAASTEVDETTTGGEDDLGFWASCPEDMLPSWEWDGETLHDLVSTDKETTSFSSTRVAALDDEVADATVNQTSPPDAGIHPPCGDHTSDLCQKFANLSYALSRDLQILSSSPSLSLSEADLGPEHDSSSCIQRAFKSFETLKSLVDELRIKTQQSPQAPSQTEALLTPNSDRGLSDVCFTGKDAYQLGGGFWATPSTMIAMTPQVRPCVDHHLDMIMALHILASYVCLNQILKHTLGSILATVVSQKKGAGDGPEASSAGKPLSLLPRWPNIHIEGLAKDDDHLLRLRLFAETCLHMATGIHKRIESLAAPTKDTMERGLSRPMRTVLGRGGGLCGEYDVDISGIKLLCSQISSAIEKHAW
ncbi:hypothetical protein LZ32DRAFT_566848 [Colletotrichum eremochloae]|nr:hypothetical protein LZ32DRAFT_566848 [Colletotrichum eremochloae]